MTEVSNQDFYEMVLPVMGWVAACDSEFFLGVDFKFKKILNRDEYTNGVSLSVTFFYSKDGVEFVNCTITIYQWGNVDRIKREMELIQLALKAKCEDELLECKRLAEEL